MAGYTDIPPSYFDTLIARPGEMLADTAVGVIEGGRKLRDMYNTTEDYLDEGLARVGDLFDRSPPRMAGGPMSRNTIRTPRLNRVRASLDENQVMPLNSTDRSYLAGLTKEDFDNYFPTEESYLANKEYNIMQHGMDYPVDNRSDWQKWKDSTKSGRR